MLPQVVELEVLSSHHCTDLPLHEIRGIWPEKLALLTVESGQKGHILL